MLSRFLCAGFSTFASKSPLHTQICVIGGGTAGLNVVAHLLHEKGIKRHQIRVFEPSKFHYYQPGWTMVGGGLIKARETVRPNSELFSKHINFTHLSVSKVDPSQNIIITDDGSQFSYEQLVIATGIHADYSQIKGAREALEDENCPVGTIYDFNSATKFNALVEQFQGGKALFTEPVMPIKCAGAPQKIVYLTEDRLIKKGLRNSSEVEFRKAAGVMFSQPKFAAALEKIAASKNIDVIKQSNLIEIKGRERIAVFQNLATKEIQEVKFDLAHIVPPMKPPQFIKESANLADASGFVDVNSKTLQHKRYSNVWAIGDSSNLPTSKTAAAVMGQTPVLVQNLMYLLNKKGVSVPAVYDGYTSCPIFVGGNKLMLAEFKYDMELAQTFSKNQEKPSSFFFRLKKDFFPWVYWNVLPYGIWYGNKGILPFLMKPFKEI